MVLVDEGVPFEGSHPMHLHGYSFQVVAMGRLGVSTTVEEVKRLDQAGASLIIFLNVFILRSCSDHKNVKA